MDRGTRRAGGARDVARGRVATYLSERIGDIVETDEVDVPARGGGGGTGTVSARLERLKTPRGGCPTAVDRAPDTCDSAPW